MVKVNGKMLNKEQFRNYILAELKVKKNKSIKEKENLK